MVGELSARGELVKESDLAQALKAGHLAGAALDVFTEELLKNSPLAALDNVILTPHEGGSTVFVKLLVTRLPSR